MSKDAHRKYLKYFEVITFEACFYRDVISTISFGISRIRIPDHSRSSSSLQVMVPHLLVLVILKELGWQVTMLGTEHSEDM